MNMLARGCALALLLTTTQTSRAQDSVEVGPQVHVLPYGFAHVEGENTTILSSTTTTERWIDFVISEVFETPLPNAKSTQKWDRMAVFRNMVSTYEKDGVDRGVHSVELETGYAYVKIEEPTMLVWTELEIVKYALQRPFILKDLAGDLVSRDFEGIDPGVLLEHFTSAAKYVAMHPALLDLLGGEREDRQLVIDLLPCTRPALMIDDGPRVRRDPAYRQVIRELLDREDLSQAEHAILVIQAVKFMMSSGNFDDIAGLIKSFRYPFLLGRRTVGGAEGTEVVVYVDPISDTESNVYYFYVASHEAETPNITVRGYTLDFFGNEIDLYETVPLSSFASMNLKRIQYGSYTEPQWVIDGGIKVHPIKRTIGTGLDAAQILTAAHLDACIAGINPTNTTLTATDGDIVLECP